MNSPAQPEPGAIAPAKALVVKIFGVGGAGVNAIEHVIAGGCDRASFVAVNTDAHSLAGSSALEKLHLETRLLRGLGSGGDPDRGRDAAQGRFAELKGLCEGVDVAFIVAGLGGGAGTGISPVLARAAKEAGALVLGFLTTPFECEGSRRMRLARDGMVELKTAADGVICLPNQKVFKLIDENTSVLETFKITNQLLSEGVLGLWRLLSHPGLIEIHFSDLSALLRDRHVESYFAVAEARGPARAREVVEKLLSHPMLEGGQMLAESGAVVVSFIGGPDLAMAEVNRVMDQIRRHCEQAQIIMGAAIDDTFRERLVVTLVAARKSAAFEERETDPVAEPEQLKTQLLDQTTTARPASRFIPPAPSLPPEQMEQLLARQAAGSGRKSSGRQIAKMRQAQLPLEIISKGRFDKSEPTIHKGEDLDVPTYIRRGVALN